MWSPVARLQCETKSIIMCILSFTCMWPSPYFTGGDAAQPKVTLYMGADKHESEYKRGQGVWTDRGVDEGKVVER